MSGTDRILIYDHTSQPGLPTVAQLAQSRLSPRINTNRWQYNHDPRPSTNPSDHSRYTLPHQRKSQIDHVILNPAWASPSSVPCNAVFFPFWSRITNLTDKPRTSVEQERLGPAGHTGGWAFLRDTVLPGLRSAQLHWDIGSGLEERIWTLKRTGSIEDILSDALERVEGNGVIISTETLESKKEAKKRLKKKRKAERMSGNDAEFMGVSKKRRLEEVSEMSEQDQFSSSSSVTSDKAATALCIPLPPYLYLAAFPCLSCTPSASKPNACPCLISGTLAPQIIPAKDSTLLSSNKGNRDLLIFPQAPCLHCAFLRSTNPDHQCLYALPLGDGKLDRTRCVQLSVVFSSRTKPHLAAASREQVLLRPRKYLYWREEDIRLVALIPAPSSRKLKEKKRTKVGVDVDAPVKTKGTNHTVQIESEVTRAEAQCVEELLPAAVNGSVAPENTLSQKPTPETLIETEGGMKTDNDETDDERPIRRAPKRSLFVHSPPPHQISTASIMLPTPSNPPLASKPSSITLLPQTKQKDLSLDTLPSTSGENPTGLSANHARPTVSRRSTFEPLGEKEPGRRAPSRRSTHDAVIRADTASTLRAAALQIDLAPMRQRAFRYGVASDEAQQATLDCKAIFTIRALGALAAETHRVELEVLSALAQVGLGGDWVTGLRCEAEEWQSEWVFEITSSAALPMLQELGRKGRGVIISHGVIWAISNVPLSADRPWFAFAVPPITFVRTYEMMSRWLVDIVSFESYSLTYPSDTPLDPSVPNPIRLIRNLEAGTPPSAFEWTFEAQLSADFAPETILVKNHHGEESLRVEWADQGCCGMCGCLSHDSGGHCQLWADASEI